MILYCDYCHWEIVMDDNDESCITLGCKNCAQDTFFRKKKNKHLLAKELAALSGEKHIGMFSFSGITSVGMEALNPTIMKIKHNKRLVAQRRQQRRTGHNKRTGRFQSQDPCKCYYYA